MAHIFFKKIAPKSSNIFATCVGEFAAKKFKKSSSLVTLIMNFLLLLLHQGSYFYRTTSDKRQIGIEFSQCQIFSFYLGSNSSSSRERGS